MGLIRFSIFRLMKKQPNGLDSLFYFQAHEKTAQWAVFFILNGIFYVVFLLYCQLIYQEGVLLRLGIHRQQPQVLP